MTSTLHLGGTLRARAYALLLLALAGSASGCSEPQFAESEQDLDAGLVDSNDAADTERSEDAATLMPESLDDAAPAPSSLHGTYALRARIFSRDTRAGTLARTTREVLYLGHIEQDAASNELILRTQRCRERIETEQPLAKFLSSMAHPQRLPAARYRVILSGSSFRTQSEPRLIGYTAAPPPGCAPGQKVAPPELRPWLPDQHCDCPAADAPPPTSPSDCRVTDADGDGQPGFSVQFAAPTVGLMGTDYYRVNDQSELVQGVVAPDRRHRAALAMSEDDYQLDCASTCVRAPHKFCSPAENTVRFAPLDEEGLLGDWSCESMLQLLDERGLFPDDPLTFPSGC